jgi:hypothetical protein
MRGWTRRVLILAAGLVAAPVGEAADGLPPTPPVTGAVEPGGCGAVAFSSQNVIGLADVADLPGLPGAVVAEVELALPCDGLAIAIFSAEAALSASSRSHVALEAVCVAPAVADGCDPLSDTPILSVPRNTLFIGPAFAWNPTGSPDGWVFHSSHAIQGLFPDLLRGHYRFTARAWSTGLNAGSLWTRALTVQAFGVPAPVSPTTGSGRPK